MTIQQARAMIREHNIKYDIKWQFEDKNPLYIYIVYKQDNFETAQTREQRTYKVRSDNKCFLGNMVGNSMYGDCLDGKDLGVRLDWYNWDIEEVYVK